MGKHSRRGERSNIKGQDGWLLAGASEHLGRVGLSPLFCPETRELGKPLAGSSLENQSHKADFPFHLNCCVHSWPAAGTPGHGVGSLLGRSSWWSIRHGPPTGAVSTQPGAIALQLGSPPVPLCPPLNLGRRLEGGGWEDRAYRVESTLKEVCLLFH